MSEIYNCKESMAKYYHFIRRNGKVSIGKLGRQLKLYRPDQLVSDSAPEWGVKSDGAKILAYSILRDSLGEDCAQHCLLKFEQEVLLPLEINEWGINENQLSEFCAYHMSLESVISNGVWQGNNASNQDRHLFYNDLPSKPLWLANINVSLNASDEN